MTIRQRLAVIVTLLISTVAWAGPHAQYIANAGVMIVSGETKIVFDPLFREDFDQYDLAPSDMQERLIAGDAPFDGIDAVFVSHNHDDHFDPDMMLAFLQNNGATLFFGPDQAVRALRGSGRELTKTISDRIYTVHPTDELAPVEFAIGELKVNAISVPHTGWPEYLSDVHNVVFSVSLDESVSVVHLGDADTNTGRFERHDEFWRATHHHLALPPYWFFLDENGRRTLSETIAADHSVGVHVPTEIPDDPEDRPSEFAGADLFTRPGEVRNVGIFDEK